MKTYYRYESTERPVDLGTFPKEGMIEFYNYRDGKHPVRDKFKNQVRSYGYIIYDRELTDQEVKDYEFSFWGTMEYSF